MVKHKRNPIQAPEDPNQESNEFSNNFHNNNSRSDVSFATDEERIPIHSSSSNSRSSTKTFRRNYNYGATTIMKKKDRDSSTDDGDSVTETNSNSTTASNGFDTESSLIVIDKTPIVISIDDAIERLGMGYFQYTLILTSGLCFASDAIEILLLSFLSRILQVEWELTNNETRFITSIVFMGALMGTLVLGYLGDRIGRKPTYMGTVLIIVLFSILTAFVQSYVSLLIIRFLVGFGIGGLNIPFDTVAEFIPTQYRGSNLLLVNYFWTLGTLLVPILAYWTLGGILTANTTEPTTLETQLLTEGWRLFVILCAIPCLVSSILAFIFVPESPRWTLINTKYTKEQQQSITVDILRKAAIQNGKHPYQLFPKNTYIVNKEEEGTNEDAYVEFDCITNKHSRVLETNRNNCFELLSVKWRHLTFNLWGLWLSQAALYYGAIMTITMIFASTSEQEQPQDTYSSGHGYGEDTNENQKVSLFVDFDYHSIFISSLSELFGLTFVIYTCDKFGRIPSQVISYVLGGSALLLLCFIPSSSSSFDNTDKVKETTIYNLNNGDTIHIIQIILAFLTRMFMMSGTCTTWLSTAEVLPTEIRTTGHSVANAVGRIGGFICPFIIALAQPTTSSSSSSSSSISDHGNDTKVVGIIFFILSIFCSFFSYQLPETVGIKQMGSSSDR